MEFSIHRDLRSIMFIRCLTPINESNQHAEGAAFTFKTAIEKCRSEAIERWFFASYQNKSRVIGIAAHPCPEASKENAISEATETLLLEMLREADSFSGFPLWNFRIKVWLGRVNDRFACLVTFPYLGTNIATQGVSKNPISAILRAWTEYRNFQIYRPRQGILPSYTKGTRILGPSRIGNLSFKFSLKQMWIELPKLEIKIHKIENRFVTTIERENI